MNKPLIVAHAGSIEGHGSESLTSYNAAIKAGVDMVEADIWRTKDDKFVCQHEPLVRGCSISRLAEKDIQPSVIRLGELLRIVAKNNSKIMIDIKETGYEKELVEYTLKSLSNEKFVMTTLNDSTVKMISKEFPNVQVGLSLSPTALDMSLNAVLAALFPWKRIKQCEAKFLSIHYSHDKLIEILQYRLLGLPVYFWTVDDLNLMHKFLKNQIVDGLITERPLAALNLLNR